MKKILLVFLLVLSSFVLLMWACWSESPPSGRAVAHQSAIPDFLSHLKLEEKFTKNSESTDIMEFKADSLDQAWDTCQLEMPNIDRAVIGGGIESTCLQYEPGKYSCLCLLKLHKKGQKTFQEHVFLLKKVAPVKTMAPIAE